MAACSFGAATASLQGLAGGLVFLAVFAERYFGLRLGHRQWVGVLITAAGLAVIGLTSGDAGEPKHYALA